MAQDDALRPTFRARGEEDDRRVVAFDPEGTMDAAGKTLTMQMTGTDPLTGKESRMRIVTRWDGDDKMIDEFHERKGGKEVKTMEIVYTRAK